MSNNYIDDQFERLAINDKYNCSIKIQSVVKSTNFISVTNAQLAQIKIILKNENINLPDISTLLHQVQHFLNANSFIVASDPATRATYHQVQTGITQSLHSLQHLG